MIKLRMWLFGCVVLACGVAHAADVKRNNVDRMTDALVALMPMGEIFEMASANDEHWPMQEKPDALTPEQLSCVRGELTTTGYRRVKRVEAADYVKANPTHVAAELALLESGAAALMGKLVLGGAQSAISGKTFDQSEVMNTVSNDEALAFMKFMTDPKYAKLREVSGIGETFKAGKTEAETQEAGHQLGFSLGAQFIIQAMGTCKVPPSAYL